MDNQSKLISADELHEQPLFCFYFTQRRKKDVKSCQRLEAAKAKVTLGITIAGVAQVAGIKVFVARVCDPTFQTSDAYNGDVELEVKQSQDTDTFNKVTNQEIFCKDLSS